MLLYLAVKKLDFRTQLLPYLLCVAFCDHDTNMISFFSDKEALYPPTSCSVVYGSLLPHCTTGASFIHPFILHTTNAWLLHMEGTKYMFTECMNEWSLYAKLNGYNQLMDFSQSVSCWEGCLGIAGSDKPLLETTGSAQRRQVFNSHVIGTRATCKHSMTR